MKIRSFVFEEFFSLDFANCILVVFSEVFKELVDLFLAVLGPGCPWWTLAAVRGAALPVALRLLAAVASLLVEHRLLGVAFSSCGRGLSGYGARLNCPGASSWTRDRTGVPRIERWVLNHWATREALWCFLKYVPLSCIFLVNWS